MIWKPRENKVTSEEITYIIFFSVISLGQHGQLLQAQFQNKFLGHNYPSFLKVL